MTKKGNLKPNSGEISKACNSAWGGRNKERRNPGCGFCKIDNKSNLSDNKHFYGIS